VCDLEPLIVAQQPRYWLFGHTHEQAREQIGGCTLVANPFGYLRMEPQINSAFDWRLILQI
jgi:hypothetical protein